MAKTNLYVSCIKINGVPLLPPLITQKIRDEMREYRQKAIEFENKLQRERLFEKCMEDLRQLQTKTVNLRAQSCRADFTANLDDQSSFNGNCTSTTDNNPTAICIDNSSSCSSSSKCKKVILTRETIDVSEYRDNEVKLINESSHDNNSDVEQTTSMSISTENSLINRPRLIRSNSYTLDSPSPILLAHLRNKTKSQTNVALRKNWDALDMSFDINNCSTPNYDSLPSDRVVPDRNSQSAVPNCKTNEGETTGYKIYETDVTVQQVKIKTPFTDLPKIYISNEYNHIDPQLLETLKHIPEDCSNQILDILKKQHEEQKSDSDYHHHFNEPILMNNNVSDLNSSQNKTAHNNHHVPRHFIKPSNITLSSTQSHYYSIIDSSMESDRSGDAEIETNHGNHSKRNLFEDGDKCKETGTIQREHAASIICAAVKGYLVRRLLKTDKVKNLIQTIKDVLLCAVQLHNSENIDESDVELHRRLIHQLSSACYAFHDIFFKLSIREQMNIISLDRRKKFDRNSRPASAVSSKSQSLRISKHKDDNKKYS